MFIINFNMQVGLPCRLERSYRYIGPSRPVCSFGCLRDLAVSKEANCPLTDSQCGGTVDQGFELTQVFSVRDLIRDETSFVESMFSEKEEELHAVRREDCVGVLRA